MPIVFQISLKKLALKGLFLPERDLSKLFNGFHYNFQTFFFADQLWFCIFPFGYFKKSDWRSLVRHYTEFVSSRKVNILLFGGAGNSRSLIKKKTLRKICYLCLLVGMSQSNLTWHNCLHIHQ